MNRTAFSWKHFLLVNLVVGVWVNASEVFRYFVIVMPAMREYLSMVPGVAPMDLGVFAIWGIWDTALVAFNVIITWLYAERFGYSMRNALIAGTIGWLFFVLFWVAQINMALAAPSMLLRALPLAWLEFAVASAIGVWMYQRLNSSVTA